MTSTRCVRENSGRLRGNNFLQTQMIPHDWQLIGQKRDNKKKIDIPSNSSSLYIWNQGSMAT